VQRVLAEHLIAGNQLYLADSMTSCAETYARAGEIASALGDRQGELEARFWEGCALHGAGRLRKALAIMAPPLTQKDVCLSEGVVYRIATRYLRVLAELPGEREQIDRALQEVEKGLVAVGKSAWRSRSLLVRARLALSLGTWREGLRLAEEALEERDHDEFGCTYTAYYWPCVLLAIWVGELDRAWTLFERWGRVDVGSYNQRVAGAWLRSCWLRQANRADEALSHARIAFAESLCKDEYPVRFTSAVELARVLLAVGELDAVREPLSRVLAVRHTEVGEHGYIARLLVGDVHHARARALAGLTPRDFDFHHLQETSRRSAGGVGEARAAVDRAHLAYRLARRRGEALDTLLDCRLREWQIADRLAQLREVEEALA
jgi:hypothetical protein